MAKCEAFVLPVIGHPNGATPYLYRLGPDTGRPIASGTFLVQRKRERGVYVISRREKRGAGWGEARNNGAAIDLFGL